MNLQYDLSMIILDVRERPVMCENVRVVCENVRGVREWRGVHGVCACRVRGCARVCG
jgi:hypothetical protein